jgi:hypothetical protein
MTKAIEPSRLLWAAALVALGATGIVNGEFALVWQNVPAHLPGRTALAYACAVAEILAGLGLLGRGTVRAACRFLLPYMLNRRRALPLCPSRGPGTGRSAPQCAPRDAHRPRVPRARAADDRHGGAAALERHPPSALARLTAHAEAAMLAVVTVWFWGPWLHTGHTATTAFIISLLIVAGVWLVADTYAGIDWLAVPGPLWKPEDARRESSSGR